MSPLVISHKSLVISSFSANCSLRRLHDIFDSHAIFFQKLSRLTRLAERVLHADEFDGNRKMLRERFCDCAAQSSVHLMFFDGHDCARFLRKLNYLFLVERLYRVAIQNDSADFLFLELTRGKQNVEQKTAAADY